jgi:hypothetical protein
VIAALALVAGLVITLLPFVLVGLLVWGTYYAVAHDRKEAWQTVRAKVSAFGRWVVAVPLAASVALCAWAVGVVRLLTPKVVPVARRAGEVARDGVEAGAALAGRGAEAAGAVVVKARSAGQVVGAVLLETVGGAAVGTILVCLAESGHHGGALLLRIVAGALTGAFLGLLVGAARGSLRTEQGT